MNDLRSTIVPKSDQLNADSLIGGPRTITITKVSLCPDADQPVALNYEGDDGKPYKPCKSMRRVLVKLWGPDGNAYVGRSLTLYRDDKVMFGGVAVGGIRISHMTHIQKEETMALTATRANRKPFTVRPLVMEAPANRQETKRLTVSEWLAALSADLEKAQDSQSVEAILARDDVRKAQETLPSASRARLDTVIQAARQRFVPPAQNESDEIDGEWDTPESAIPDEAA